MKTPYLLLLLIVALSFTGCDDDDDPIQPILEIPSTYDFVRNGQTSVSFNGQLTRIEMAEVLSASMNNTDEDANSLFAMFTNADGAFEDAELDASTKNIRSKVAASADLFFTDSQNQARIRSDFDSWLTAQSSVLDAIENNDNAAAGVAGRIADGSSIRFVAGNGVEYNQLFIKGLIGALMYDQAANNYLSPAVLDEADNRATNDAGSLAADKNYTTMEHKWDEAFGYLLATPDDRFFSKYLGRVEDDPDYAGITERLTTAFIRGRAAIVAGEYNIRDEEAGKIIEAMNTVIGVRTVYYLVQGANLLDSPTPDYGGAFHDLSEGLGFLYATQFTDRMSFSETQQLFDDLGFENDRFLWEVTPAQLRAAANTVADKFGLDLDQASSTN